MFKKTLLSLAVASSLGLTGCFSDGGTGKNANPDPKLTDSSVDGKTWPIFNPASGDIPLPNDILFSGTVDGTFKIDDPEPPVSSALDQLSGASTVAPMVIRTSGELDASTVVAGETVHLVEVTYASGDPVQALSIQDKPTLELALSGAANLPKIRADVETLATTGDLAGTSAIRILPLEPLKPGKRYIVVITNGVKDASGEAIIKHPNPASYGALSSEDATLISEDLLPVRNLVRNFWEPVAESYLNAIGSEYGREDIALSYSFTTSNDEKVLQYIAEPQAWFVDQITTFLRVSAAEAVVKEELDLNDDGKVDYDDALIAADGAVAGFPDEDTEAALGDVFAGAPPAGCAGTEGETAIECVGVALASAPSTDGGFADLLPTPAAGTVTASAADAQDAAEVSVLLSSIVDSEGPGVSVVQGSVTLPYYLGTSGADLVTDSWQADDSLATAMNSAFEDIGLVLPQADPSVSAAVNYIFPFPKETEEVTVPMLIMHSNDAALDGTTPVVIFQHGITTDRSAALAFGSALADATCAVECAAVVAIDQPLHGVSPFSVDDQLELAGTLLTANDPELNTEGNREAVVAGLFATGLLQQIDAACAAIDVDFTDPESIATGKQQVAGGACEGDVEGSTAQMRSALGIEGTVARAGSTIPGLAPTENERHFNFTADASNQPTPMVFDTDNPVGESGSLFINLGNFLAGRDNLRQGAVDLMNLRASLGEIDLDGDTTGDLDTGNVYFVGHSLGTVNGTPYVASVNENQVQYGGGKVTDDIVAANMLTPGGGIVRLLENSPAFAPTILGGLSAAAGLEQGDADLETFFNVFQAALDTVDPINFADNIVSSATPTLLSEVIGDEVIPNAADPEVLGNAFPAPLAGTEPLATQLNAATVATGSVALDPAGITRYTEGNHSTPVYPLTGTEEENAVFAEMVGQAVSMVLNGGAEVTVTEESVVEQE
ncbi:MAG: hypothetical protein ACQEV6_13085 [Pseudomonadota bacterium]